MMIKKLLATTVLTSFLAVPAFAQDNQAKMTCSEFTALDAAAQAEALTSIESRMGMDTGATEDISTAGDNTGAVAGATIDVAAEIVVQAARTGPDLTVQEATEQALTN